MDIVSQQGVPNVTVQLWENDNCLVPEGCDSSPIDQVVTDSNGNFAFTFDAKMASKWTYSCYIPEYGVKFADLAEKTLYYNDSQPFTKHQSNTVELKVCPKAYVNMLVSNDVNPSVSDSLYVIFENRAIACKSEMGPRVGVNPLGVPTGRQLYHLPHGMLSIEIITIKNGLKTSRTDSLNLVAGTTTLYDVLY
jgi:hypothetical protein